MDTSYSWHPGTARVVSSWPVPVPLLPDELLSSWLVRAALAQGCDPLVLTGELWPKWRIWTMDPDRGLNIDHLSALARASGIEAQSFNAASLRQIISAVTSDTLDGLATWPWVLSLGSRNRKRHGGLQYCPACLHEDRKPYFRIQGRLAWHTGCAVHGTSLVDRCPHCEAPVEPHRLSALGGNMTICAICERSLCESSGAIADADAFAFQQAADQAVMCGQGQYGVESLQSHEWFALSRYFMTLLRKVTLGKSERLTAFAKALDVNVDAIASPATGLGLEVLPVQERAMLLAGAWRMIMSGSERFIEAAQSESLTTPSLRDKGQPLPRCLQSIILALPDKSVVRRQKEQDGSPKPRSRQAVMHMWARLQRKMAVETK